MEAGPRISASKQAAREDRQGSDSEGRRRKKRKKYEWMVTEVEDTRIKMKRRRVAGFRSRDLAVFYQLLNDPVIEQFLKSDVKYYSDDENLLAVLAKYFGRLEFPSESDSVVQPFLALCSACQLDTVNLSFRWHVLPSTFGNTWSQGDFRRFWPLQIEFLSAIDWRAWVREETYEEVSDDGSETSVLQELE